MLVKINDDVLIGIIIAAVTIISIIMLLLHANDPVYPAKILTGETSYTFVPQ